ncbi:MAG TPA: hypothetical protein VNK49_12700 [Anaerolineales bacterium]|nr:hypothetical protein [Anaerolineales bacterium]
MFPVLFGGGRLGRGEEQGRLLAGAEEQKRLVGIKEMSTLRAGDLVKRALLRLFQQVGARGGVYDEPRIGAEGCSTAGAGQVGGLREGRGHGLSSRFL